MKSRRVGGRRLLPSSTLGAGLERLEPRVNPSAASPVPVLPSPRVGIGAPVVATPTPARAVHQVAELTTSSAAVVAAFAAKNRVWSASVDIVVPSLGDAKSLRLSVPAGPTYWNGRLAAKFAPAPANVRVDLAVGGQAAAVRAAQPQPGGAGSLTLAASATSRVTATIRVEGRPSATPAAGWYRVTARLAAPTGGAATTLTLLFSVGAVSASSRFAATRAVGGVGTKPEAVTVGAKLAPPTTAAALSVAPPAAPLAAVLPPSAPPPPASLLAPKFTLPAAVNGVVELKSDITGDVTFAAGTVYLISSEVHVFNGVTLTIEDGVEVRIRNGYGRFQYLTSPALIFDSGSKLRAKTVTFLAADETTGQPDTKANNGGVFFCGASQAATKDNVSSQNLPYVNSSFVADRIVTQYLGRKDPGRGDGDGHTRDDIDSISVVGAGWGEWQVRAVDIRHSGDDGFDLTNSSIRMEDVRVDNPTEDGLNLTSSTLYITGSLTIDMTDSPRPDREIFDFEVDSGPTTVIIQQKADVDIRGYWDNRPYDLRIYVRSVEMPRPSSNVREWYSWKGRITTVQTEIFSLP